MKKFDWINFSFLILTPLAAATWAPLHIYFNGLKPSLLIFFFIYSIFTSLSVTAGYHRLFAHRSYEAKPWVKVLLLIFGAAALQNSALKWASDHRRHHANVDGDDDPYSIKKGFFYAHMGWIFFTEDPKFKNKFAPDLAKDPLVLWQHKYYLTIAILTGGIFPILVGWALGSPMGGLLYGGLLRIVFTHHCTFFINSLCHYLGRQPYSDENSAKDSVLMALLTYGEGYHNFHHKFQIDYRNGIRWYHWDPTKWFIQILNLFGQTYKLREVPENQILKARLELEEKKLLKRGASAQRLQNIKDRINEAQSRAKKLHEEYQKLRREKIDAYQSKIIEIHTELRLAQVEFKAARKQWAIYAAHPFDRSPSQI